MADNILTRNIGPFPGWVWGGAAVIGGLLFFAARRSKTPTAAGMPAVSPAASTFAVPFVPSVSGVPPGASPLSPSTSTALPGPAGLVADSTSNPNSTSGVSIPTYTVTNPTIQPTTTGLIANGTQLTPTGQTMTTVWGSGQNTFIQVKWSGGTVWVSQSDVRPSAGGGAGGWGQAGQAAPGGFMGWTWLAGWPGLTSAAGTSVGQRTGLQRAGAGSGASSTVNRTGVSRKSKILRRRALTGR